MEARMKTRAGWLVTVTCGTSAAVAAWMFIASEPGTMESLLNMGMRSPETVGHDSKANSGPRHEEGQGPAPSQADKTGPPGPQGPRGIRDLRVFKAFRARSEKAAHPGPKETKALPARLVSLGPRVKPERRDPRATRDHRVKPGRRGPRASLDRRVKPEHKDPKATRDRRAKPDRRAPRASLDRRVKPEHKDPKATRDRRVKPDRRAPRATPDRRDPREMQDRRVRKASPARWAPRFGSSVASLPLRAAPARR